VSHLSIFQGGHQHVTPPSAIKTFHGLIESTTTPPSTSSSSHVGASDRSCQVTGTPGIVTCCRYGDDAGFGDDIDGSI
jgi:hypothetical protein